MNLNSGISKQEVEEIMTELKTREGSAQVAVKQEDAFFAEIVGYSDIKKIVMKCINSSDREPVHVILDGPPASAKSMFLIAMKNKLKNTYYVDGTNATGPGMVKYLFENDVKYLLLDEVEKMSKDNQNVLLNVMETGILTSYKSKKY